MQKNRKMIALFRNVQRRTPQSLLWLVVITCILGAGLALFATRQTIQIQQLGVENPGPCTINAWINCEAAQASSDALMAGVPVAWWGFLFYVWIGATVAYAAHQREQGRPAAIAAFIFSLAGLLCVFYKAYQMAFKLKILCPVCVAMYAANLTIVLLLAKQLSLMWQTIPRLLSAYFKGIVGKHAHLDFSPAAALYFTSAAVLFSAGLGAMKYVNEKSPSFSQLDLKAEVTKHFLQPARAIAIDSSFTVWGNPEGAVTIVEFSDFQCPACRAAAFYLREALGEFRSEVRFYFVNFPLDKQINPYLQDQVHEEAGLAARAAVCARQRGGFWGFHDDLFRHQHELNRDLILRLAEKRGWNPNEFAAEMDAEQTVIRVRADIERGRRAQVQATPTIVINGRRVEYWHHAEILRAIIRVELQRIHTPQIFTTKHFRRPYETQ